jgi:outer membrane lipoprotein-sorting protein
MTRDTLLARRSVPPAVTRERTLDAAGELLTMRGLVGLTVDAVAERAGTTTQAIQRWWPSEEALAPDALRHEWLGLAAHVYRRAVNAGLRWVAVDLGTLIVSSEIGPTVFPLSPFESRLPVFSFVRNAPTRKLVLTALAVLGLLATVTAIAVAATGNSAKPPAKPISSAVHDALSAPRIQGVTARISFTNRLIESSSIQGGGTPLLSGASGRLWASDDGRIRLELQSELGDVEVLSDGKTLMVYDATRNTVYKLALPPSAVEHTPSSGVPSIATIEKTLSQLGTDANISGATPSNVAGREAYTVQVSPKHDGGLLGSVQLAWDASNGIPLRVAVYAAGSSSPVLELKATEINFGAVDSSVYAIAPPANAEVIDLTSPAGQSANEGYGSQPTVSGATAVQKELTFALAAPSTLDGLPQQEVHLASVNSSKAALVTYGKGLGGIAVLEQPANKSSGGASGKDISGSLPSVSIDGATGHELATALGTVLTFDRGGVSYTVIGSIPPVAAEAAARGL